MMYNNKLVAVIKVNGQILRESGTNVYIPFGSEYSIHFKNLHTTKAVIDVTIDGEDVLDGSSLVVRPDNDGKIEGFMRGNSVSHKFKFIEKTQEISDFRGDDISDGLIRIVFKFEEPVRPWTPNRPYFEDPYNIRYGGTFDGAYGGADVRLRHFGSHQAYGSSAGAPKTADIEISSCHNDMDQGITVKGSESNQTFTTTTLGTLERVEYSIVFQLRGENRSKKIEQPILIKTKLKCETCGRVSSSNQKFCGNCGTSLVI